MNKWYFIVATFTSGVSIFETIIGNIALGLSFAAMAIIILYLGTKNEN